MLATGIIPCSCFRITKAITNTYQAMDDESEDELGSELEEEEEEEVVLSIPEEQEQWEAEMFGEPVWDNIDLDRELE